MSTRGTRADGTGTGGTGPGTGRARERAAGSSALLLDAVTRGFVETGDLYLARRIAGLAGTPISDEAVLATALAVRAAANGSTCVELDGLTDPVPGPVLAAALASSPLVTGCPSGPLKPLALAGTGDGRLLYLRKYFEHEQTVRRILDERAARLPAVDGARLDAAIERVFAGSTDERQRSAARVAATRWTTVLAGGPGTGKTYTVARIIAVLRELLGSDLRIGLCAPTGRAAAQLQASINQYARAAGDGGRLTAVTVHALVGARPDGTFRHGSGNKVAYDVVVADETSMLSVSMMARLLESLRGDARLILVGDPNQLVSVDAGSVLADLVARGGDDRVTLTRRYRFGAEIGDVADAVNDGDADRAVALLTAGAAVTLTGEDDLGGIRADVVAWDAAMAGPATAGDVPGALAALGAHRVLCAHREGRYGVGGWSRQTAEWIGHARHRPLPLGPGSWYPGQPLLVTATDRALGVYNGDCGVVVRGAPGLGHGQIGVVFARGDDVKTLHPSQLEDAVTAHAMTIHRSQGSQFTSVSVVLPPPESQLLTRELLYTAITRARERVRIIGSEESLRAAIGRQAARASGLRTDLTEL